MWKFAEIDAVSENFVNVLQKISTDVTIWAAQIGLWRLARPLPFVIYL